MSRKQKKNLIRILAALVLLIAAWLLPLKGWWRLAAFCVPYAVIGYDVIRTAVLHILHGQVFDENFLMMIATLGAFVLGEYPEAVAVMLFYQVGEWFQSVAVGRTRRSVSALMDIRPDSAVVLRNGEEETVSPEEVRAGETVIVRPGQRVPLDGEIIEGEADFDTAALTGESLPRHIAAGEKVYSGTVDLNGKIHVCVHGTYAESTVARILEMAENAASKKAKTEKFITRFARWYTPCVVIGALLVATVPSLITGAWQVWVMRALTFLVVSCPCALVVSVPLSFFGGIGGASRSGILIKGSNDIEALSAMKTLAMDKTGTLTRGRFEVVDIHPDQIPEADLLDIAALAESNSTHPIAASIVRAHGGHIDQKRISSMEEFSGRGIRAVIDGKTVLAGNEALMRQENIAFRTCHLTGTIIHVAIDGVYAGHIVIADTLKPEAKEAIAALRALGVSRTVLLTGDRKAVGEETATALGIAECRTELLPDQKVLEVERLQRENRNGTLGFVGDGMNDAPVLARADVGIAMGALGSDAAIESADIVLMDDQLMKLPLAIRLARRTMRIVYENIWFAIGIKIAVLILGALGVANMWWAVFADVGVLILAVLNAMRAIRKIR